MKTLRPPLAVLILPALLVLLFLLSWNYVIRLNAKQFATTLASSSESDNTLSAEEMYAYLADRETAASTDQPPAAEDVLVEKIPGDKSHLLIMAYYSKENFSKPQFTIENGFTITFRDDGKGYDKKAGDGLYTARIPADVEDFRKQAISIRQTMKRVNYVPVRFVRREKIIDPDISATFETESFDANEAVSIAGVTNGLSADLTNSQITLEAIKKNSVLITNLAVVEDPTRTWNSCTQTGNVDGAWTFKTLMRHLASSNPNNLATDAQVSTFVKNWLNQWATQQVINEDTVQARELINTIVINPWLNRSQQNGAPAGQLDMKFAPFKLTAIINRFDLRNGQKFGIPGSPCGEGRFVFCLIKNNCSGSDRFTIILEYGINNSGSCSDQKSWAQQWVNLKDLTLGSPEYNQALQNITDQFTLCGTNPNKPNQSSLDQLRTNELTLSPTTPKIWELREFILNNTGQLQQTTVGQNPADKYNAKVINPEVQRMVAFVNKNRRSIKAGKHVVPLTWQGFAFLGAKSHITGAATGAPPDVFHWNGTDSTNPPTFITDNLSRSNFSLETCGGCHGGEAQVNFTHIDPAFYGQEAGMSGFLTGKAGSGGAVDFDNDSTNNSMAVQDPALRPSPTNPGIRRFNDIEARGKDLKNFSKTTCGSVLSISSQLMFQPVNMVH